LAHIELDELDEEYDDDDFEHFLMRGLCPAFCTECGSFVTGRAAVDNQWVGGDGMEECLSCGPGTEIQSVMIIAGLA
jgi:hypothetical protein